jgi:hypothetical protein
MGCAAGILGHRRGGKTVNFKRAIPFAWADLPALLLAAVSAATVTAGAGLLRGQNPIVMGTLGLGVAGATFVLDKLLVERLNALRPTQSFACLLICWIPLFCFATALGAATTFNAIAPRIVQREVEQSFRAHWRTEASKVSTYILNLTTALQKQVDAITLEIDREKGRLAAARQERTAYSPETLQGLKRRQDTARVLLRQATAVNPIPLESPAEPGKGGGQIDRVYRDLSRIHASAASALDDPPAMPEYEPFIPPATDLQSLLAEETKRKSWPALGAWGVSFWLELLPILALWRGGRRYRLSVRIGEWRRRTRDVWHALLGRQTPEPLPILIMPLQLRGTLRLALPGDYTLGEVTPLLEDAVSNLAGIRGYRVAQLSNLQGEHLEEALPVLPQLRGGPLVLSVVEGGQ